MADLGQPRGRAGGAQAAQTVRYFKDENRRVVEERLLDEEAERWAKELGGVTTTQLRRFYEDALDLRRRLNHLEINGRENREAAFERLRAEFKLLRAKAYYANTRAGDRLKPLQEFIENHVRSVKTARDFDIFCRHFEAVVAFHKPRRR